MNGRVSPRSSYAKFYRRTDDAVIRGYNEAGNVIETHEHAGGVQRVVSFALVSGNFGLLFHLALIMTNSCFLFTGSAS